MTGEAHTVLSSMQLGRIKRSLSYRRGRSSREKNITLQSEFFLFLKQKNGTISHWLRFLPLDSTESSLSSHGSGHTSVLHSNQHALGNFLVSVVEDIDNTMCL